MKTRRNRKRRTKRGGWPWSKPKEPEPEVITEDEANRIALQITQNVLSRDISRNATRVLYNGKDSKQIKLALTKVLPSYSRDKELFDFVYYELERDANERLRLLNADMEAVEIIDYVKNSVPLHGINYILSRSQDFMKLKSALTKKVDIQQYPFNSILFTLDQLKGKKEDAAYNESLRNRSRWSDP